MSKSMVSRGIDIVLWLALIIVALLTVRLFFSHSLYSAMLVAPWMLIIVLTMRGKSYADRLRALEATAAKPRPIVVNTARRAR